MKRREREVEWEVGKEGGKKGTSEEPCRVQPKIERRRKTCMK